MDFQAETQAKKVSIELPLRHMGFMLAGAAEGDGQSSSSATAATVGEATAVRVGI